MKFNKKNPFSQITQIQQDYFPIHSENPNNQNASEFQLDSNFHISFKYMLLLLITKVSDFVQVLGFPQYQISYWNICDMIDGNKLDVADTDLALCRQKW